VQAAVAVVMNLRLPVREETVEVGPGHKMRQVFPQVQQIVEVAAAVLVDSMLLLEEMGHQALSLFVTLVLKGARAAQLHLAVVTQFIHLHLQELTRRKFRARFIDAFFQY
jgi:hypothetical protein